MVPRSRVRNELVGADLGLKASRGVCSAVVVYEPRNHSVDAVVRAPSDGYTLLLTHAEDVYNELLYPVRFKYIRDIAPVASIIRTPFVMVVSPSFPATTVPAFIAYAKSNLGKVNMASAGVGSGNHLSGELFKMMAVGHNVKCLN